MHKAVAARLANPSLSLYEALCIGGFDYSENDDKSVLDSKKVTLGQRKNQLSRRLRLARKQNSAEAKAASVQSTTTNGTLTGGNKRHHDETNGIKIDQEDPSGKPSHHALMGHHRSKMDWINELGTSSFNNNSNGRNGEAMGSQASKRQRLTRCLNSTTFERTCTSAPINQYLHQGWPSNAMMASGTMLAPSHYSSSQYYPPQMANRIPDQNLQQQYQQGTSSVALSSLATTAQAVGLSLDQLALTLSSNTNSLSKLVSEVRSGVSEQNQEQLALDLFKNDVKGLYTNCLLRAGVDRNLAEQNTPTYIKFAMKAYEAEGKRLRSLNETLGRGKQKKNVTIASPPQSTRVRANSRSSMNDNATAGVSSDSNEYIQDQNESNSNDRQNDNHSNISGQDSANDGNASEKDDKCGNRHMHRLGECGHRAIIHQPKDGTPHIDFIVNDQIECYGGQDSVSLANKSFDNAWPSKYKCKDVDESCSKSCSKSVASDVVSTWGNMDSLGQEPKNFKLSEIDPDDPEWTFDANEDSDGGVMGLFKLGRETSNELTST